MTDPKIAALVEALEAGPTPGPWTDSFSVVRYDDGYGIIASCSLAPHRSSADLNSAFIAAARDGVPALLARVDELEGECDELRRANAQLFKRGERMYKARETALVRARELETALRTMRAAYSMVVIGQGVKPEDQPSIESANELLGPMP